MSTPNPTREQLLALVSRMASMPLSTEDTMATWCAPDWEDVVEWYDAFVAEARELTGKSYRQKVQS